MNTGIDVLDKTVQETIVWLNDIGDRLDADRRDSYNALRAVLIAVRDRVGADNAAHFAAQLPLMIRGVFYDGFRPSATPSKERRKEAFLEHVDSAVFRGLDVDPEQAVKTVLEVVAEHIDPSEIEKLRDLFPEKMRDLWPELAALRPVRRSAAQRGAAARGRSTAKRGRASPRVQRDTGRRRDSGRREAPGPLP
jgi:uncharacterized protein (DUF2267 family)